MADSTRVINLRLDAKQFNSAMKGVEGNTAKLNKQVEKTNKNLDAMGKEFSRATGFSKELNRSINSLRNVFAALFVLKIAEGFISELQAVDNQLKIATSTTEEYIFVQERLFRVAQETRQSYEATVKLYARLVRANDQLGLSQNEIIKITTNIGKALAAQGASAQEARSVLLQLSQAFGSGRLAGEEFRAVAEGAPLILKDLAIALDTNVGALKEMAAAGELTGRVVGEALIEATKTQEEFSKSTITLGGALVKLNNAFQQFIRTTNSTAGFQLLAQAIEFAADNFDILASAMLAFMGIKIYIWLVKLAALFYSTVIPAIVTFGTSFLTAALATGSFSTAIIYATGSVKGLTAAFIATGIGALVVLFGALIAKVLSLANEFGSFGTLVDVTMLGIEIRFKTFMAFLIESIPGLNTYFKTFTEGLRASAAAAEVELDGILNKLGETQQKQRELAKLGGGGPQTDAQKETERLKTLADGIIKDLRSASEIYAEAEADIFAAVDRNLISDDTAALYLRNLQAELDPTTQAAETFNKTLQDMALQAAVVHSGMTELEFAFRSQASAAKLSVEATDALWVAYVSWKKTVDDAAEALKKEEAATKAASKAKEDWARLLEKSLTPQLAYIKQIDAIQALGLKVGASQEVIDAELRKAALAYYDASDGAKALKKAEQDLIDQSAELMSRLDVSQISKDYEAQAAALQTLRDRNLISAEAHNKRLVEIDNEKNAKLIENGTKTMQILSSVSDEFVSGFGDAMLDFAQGSESAFDDFAKSFIASMADMVVQTLILIPLMEALQALIAGLGGPNLTPGPSDIIAGPPAPGVASFRSSGLSAASASINTAGAAAASSVVRSTTTAVTGSASSSSRSANKDSGGNQVNVIVNNSSPAQVDVRQSQTSDGTELEILVTNAVRQGFQNGQMDETMSSTYGLQRRGF